MTLKEQLIENAEDYCAKRQFSLARLATIVINDGKFFKRVKTGGGCTIQTYEKFQSYFAENPPEKAA